MVQDVDINSPPKKKSNIIIDPSATILSTPVRNNLTKNSKGNSSNGNTEDNNDNGSNFQIFERFEKLELQSAEDRKKLNNMSNQITTLQDQINTSIKNIDNLQTNIIEHIETKVENNFNSLYTTFEEKIESTLINHVKVLESTTDKKLDALRTEQSQFYSKHQQFVGEFYVGRAAQQAQADAMMAMLEAIQNSAKSTQSNRVTRQKSKPTSSVQNVEDGITPTCDMNE
jgi:septation ring formation regulator EzrA